MNIRLDYLNGLSLEELCTKYSEDLEGVISRLGRVVKTKTSSVERFQYICNEYIKGVSPKEIAKALGRTTHAVMLVLNDYELREVNKSNPLTRGQIEEAKRLYSEGATLTVIGKTVNRDADTIRYYLKREGVYKQKHFVNTMDETLIETFGEKAEDYYFYGFCLADGSVSKNRLIIELNDRDEELLEKFRDSYHPKAKICHRISRPLASLNLCTKDFVDKVRAMGIRENKKSRGVEFIPEILYTNKRYASACLLGYIDGDGWQTLVYNKNYRVGLTGCEDVLKFLKILVEIHFSDVKFYYNKSKPTYSQMYFNSQLDTLKFMDYLYSCTDTYMERKRLKWLTALELKTKSKRKTTLVTKEFIDNLLSLTEKEKEVFLKRIEKVSK